MQNTNTPTLAVSLTVEDPAAALDFYGNAFGIKELFRMPAPSGLVFHAEFMIGNTRMLISCGAPDWQAVAMPAGVTASCLFGVLVDDPDAAYKTALEAGCESIEAPKDQFWGNRSAIVRDPFGYRWNLYKVVEELSAEEIGKRAAKLFGGC